MLGARAAPLSISHLTCSTIAVSRGTRVITEPDKGSEIMDPRRWSLPGGECGN